MITVLMTTYNSEEYVEEAVKSILAQSFRDFEFLIVDDGSSDRTVDIIKSFKDSRIVLERLEHKGCAHATNYGLRKAAFDWVAKNDSDDVSYPDRLKLQMEKINPNETKVICSFADFFNEKGAIFTRETPSGKELKKKTSLHNYINNSTVLYNRKFILANGGYDETVKRIEDYELWLRLLNKCSFEVINKSLVSVRFRPDSESNFNKLENRKDIYSKQEKYYKDLAEHFGIENENDQLIIRGWREFFYGDKEKARYFWNKILLKKPQLKIYGAYALTFLDDEKLDKIREQRYLLRLRKLLSI